MTVKVASFDSRMSLQNARDCRLLDDSPGTLALISARPAILRHDEVTLPLWAGVPVEVEVVTPECVSWYYRADPPPRSGDPASLSIDVELTVQVDSARIKIEDMLHNSAEWTVYPDDEVASIEYEDVPSPLTGKTFTLLVWATIGEVETYLGAVCSFCIVIPAYRGRMQTDSGIC